MKERDDYENQSELNCSVVRCAQCQVSEMVCENE